jgi:hypothetical protein
VLDIFDLYYSLFYSLSDQIPSYHSPMTTGK